MSNQTKANQPPSPPPNFNLEEWPPGVEDLTEKNIQQWFEQLMFAPTQATSDELQGAALISAVSVIRGLMQHFQHTPQELSDEAKMQFVCIQMAVQYSNLYKQLCLMIEKQPVRMSPVDWTAE